MKKTKIGDYVVIKGLRDQVSVPVSTSNTPELKLGDVYSPEFVKELFSFSGDPTVRLF